MRHQIHIGWAGDAWYARFDKVLVKSLASVDKNLVVKSAMSLARLMYHQSVLIIHGLDGRVLEQRVVDNSPEK